MATIIEKKIGTNSVYTVWLEWEVNAQSTTNNSSNITVSLKAKRNDGSPSFGAYNNYNNNTIRLTVGGSDKVNTSTANIDLRTSTGVTLATWTGDVAHNANGSLSLALEGYFYFNTSAASSLPKGGYTVSGTAVLPTIALKSTVSCSNATIGNAAKITINRANSAYTHTLTYTFGNLSGTIAAKTTSTTVNWTLPTTFYGQMAGSATKTGTVTCQTFNGSTSLGTATCTFTATALAKSTVTCTNGNIESNVTITINRKSTDFTHTLTYAFGSLSGTIASKTTSTSVTWQLPAAFYAEMGSSKSKTGTITCQTFAGSTSLGTNSCSFTATMLSASTVVCTDANVGSGAIITINRKSSHFTHTLKYTFGSLSGTLAAKTANTSVGWTLPDSFYAEMPNSKTKTGTISCETFSGNVSLGATTCTFTATAISTVTVGGTVVDINDDTIALTGDRNTLVKYFSTAYATITAATNHSATIRSKTINGNTVAKGDSYTFRNSEAAAFVFSATDSREYAGSKTVTPKIVPYVKLTISGTAKRETSTGDTVIVSLRGNYYNGSFGAADNALTVTIQSRVSGASQWSTVAVTPEISGNEFTAALVLSGFDYRTEYEMRFAAADKLDTYTFTVPILRGIPVFDWGRDDFKFNVPVNIDGGEKGAANGVAALDVLGGIVADGNQVATIQTGNFTPALIDRSNGAKLNYSCSSCVGRYVKIGNFVFISIYISRISGLDGTALRAGVNGLPFKPIDDVSFSLALYSYYDLFTSLSAGDIPTASVPGGLKHVAFWHTQGGNSAQFAQQRNNGFLAVSGAYLTDE